MEANTRKAIINVRTDPALKAEIAKAARLARVPFSEFVRQASVACARQVIETAGKAA